MSITLANARLLAQGRTAEVYAWGEGRVLKLYRAEFPRAWVQGEIEVNQQLADAGLPLPRLYDVREVDGRLGLVFERVDGPTLLQVMKSRPWRMVGLARQLAEVQARLHQQRVVGLPDARDGLRFAIRRVDVLSDGQKQQLERVIDDLPAGAALCHYDLHPEQVVMSARGPLVLDWMTAKQGHPAGDVARTQLLLGVGTPSDMAWVTRLFVKVARGVLLRAYLRAYYSANPAVSPADVAAWSLPTCAARLAEGIVEERDGLLERVANGFRTG